MEAARAAPETTAIEAASETAATAKTASAAIEAAPPEVAITEAAAKKTAIVETTEPWASPDEEAIHKVLRTVEPVRRASIWVIAVVAVGAHRSRTVVARANCHSKRDLRMRRGRRREHKDGQ